MTRWRRRSTARQLADHLRSELTSGRWQGTMPGIMKLAGELGVSRDSVEAALVELEREGLLLAQGRGKGRTIVADGTGARTRPLRVAFLLYEASDAQLHYVVEVRHQLIEAGHHVVIAPRCLTDLRMEVPRVAKVVGKTAADAWVVLAGSREVLEWFAVQPTPALALFGRHRTVAIAAVGPSHLSAILTATQKLIELGHRRIVMLTRPERRIPQPGYTERTILDEMVKHGLSVGPYNLPDWDDTREGLHRCLDELYRFTPPTALIVDEAPILLATKQYLARRGITAPQQVSLVCCDPSPAFAWFEPPITHIRWDSRPLVHHIVRWVDGVARGKNARRKMLTKAEFIEAGTIGPVAGAKAGT